MSDFEDRFAIWELIDRWSDAGRQRDWDALESVLTEDGVWESGPPFSFIAQGSKNVVAAAKEKVSSMEFLVQIPLTRVIWVEGNQAKARCAIQEVCRYKDGRGMQIFATYSDDLVKTDKGWRFKRRSFLIECLNQEPPAGQLLNPMTVKD